MLPRAHHVRGSSRGESELVPKAPVMSHYRKLLALACSWTVDRLEAITLIFVETPSRSPLENEKRGGAPPTTVPSAVSEIALCQFPLICMTGQRTITIATAADIAMAAIPTTMLLT